jgi:hypothetical protein
MSKIKYYNKAFVELYDYIQEWRNKHRDTKITIGEMTHAQRLTLQMFFAALGELENTILITEGTFKED